MTAHLGLHLIADLYDGSGLDDPALIERAIRDAVLASGVTLLDLRLHHFGPEQGVTGVALLAESHISIHTWPEHRYAAVDIFMCAGEGAAERGLDALCRHLNPGRVSSSALRRGAGQTLDSAQPRRRAETPIRES
jgi:S-adenosylmethionine decarboxylase